MVTVSLVTDAILNTAGSKVVVRWLVCMAKEEAKAAPKEKEKAKARRAEKEKGEEEEAGHQEAHL